MTALHRPREQDRPPEPGPWCVCVWCVVCVVCVVAW